MKYIRIAVACLLLVLVAACNMDVYAAEDIDPGVPLLVLDDAASFQVDALDMERESGKLTIYTVNYGEYTRPFKESTHEYITVNNIIIGENTKGESGTYIPPNGFVISYTGSNTKLTDSLAPGRQITLSNVEMPSLPDIYFKLGDLLVPIDQVNRSREANQVVLYDSSFGATTRTNAWGMELTITNGIISKITDITNTNGIMLDNDSQIPADGIIISIHSGSRYYKQLHESCKPGDRLIVAGDSKLYDAGKTKYSAYSPRSIADNTEAWDKAKGKPYDGFRGPNQLIIYDGSYGTHTGTNSYGFEVTVNNEGRITAAGGNDSVIPEGGYVLSGHGDKINWLQKYALPGASVEFNKDKKELLIIHSPDTYIASAAMSIKSAQDSLKEARLQYRDIPYEEILVRVNDAQAVLDSIKSQVDKGNYGDLFNSFKRIQNDADAAYFMTFESFKVENRAVWLRPRDTSIVQIQKRLDLLKELNINTLYLETYWNGYSIYPTGSEILPQNPVFKGMDILEIYLKEAHARGIEVHAWVENFLVDQPVASIKPEWMAISRKGDNYYLENGVTKYYFLNPALPEVRNFISALYKDLVRKYNLDGIQFDYMRYSHSGDYSNDFGYDSYTRKLFSSYTGTDPIGLKPGDALWNKWCDFRAYCVSTYAYRIFSEVKSIKPGIKISSDVWPEYDKTLKDIYQDPKAWTYRDYVNNLVPMSYYLDEVSVVQDIMNSLPFVRGHSQLISGIATFNKVDTRVFLRQINAVRASNINGIAIFEFESLFRGKYAEALKLGAFRNPSIVTNRRPEQAVNAILGDISRKFDDIYLKYGGINTKQAGQYKNLLNGIKVSFGKNSGDIKAAYLLRENIQNLLVTVNTDETLNEEVASRISTDLHNALNIIEAYISDNRLITSHKVMRFQAEIPLIELENSKTAPVRIKAVFDDNTSMYLDRTQYAMKSGNPASLEITGDMLRLAKDNNGAVLSIDILDSFKFDTIDETARKIEIEFSKDGKTPEPVLAAYDTGYTDVRLDWGGMVINSEIAGYILYRDNEEILRLSSHAYTDRSLQPGESYTYKIQGFDLEGNILYTSNQLTVKTKASPLITMP